MKNLTKILIKLDLLVYVIFSLATLIGGILMVTVEYEPSGSSKNVSEVFSFLGAFLLFIGVACCIATFIKIRNTKFTN
ncbi:MAG: hypothetical protein CMC15_06940 [Flavobacteriaceae bacterium]|nr:hypothetical protein [Flavobacteriaceae bacterium]|tara:strand:- start:14028 stop:14261 length:234 start_codon:yes stop_codon:yes gene_type:complete